MPTIIAQKKGSFVRLHGIFGITLRGVIVFADDAMYVTKKAASTDHALDVLPYSEISDFTRSLITSRDVRYQITTTAGKKCTLILLGEVDHNIEDFIRSKTKLYKNLAEKSVQLETNAESELFSVLSAKHISGLPLAEGIEIKIAANQEKISFLHNRQEINLSSSKIMDISIKTDVEIHSYYGSNLGNAILGGYFFGAAGAMIGGQAREQKRAHQKHFLIISYRKDGKQAFLSFQIDDLQAANKIVSYYAKKNPEPVKIEL